MATKKMYKSTHDKKICGVCGGIAEYFNIDSTLTRLAWLILTIISCGTGIIAYIIAAIIMPNRFIDDEPVNSYNNSNQCDKSNRPVSDADKEFNSHFGKN